MVALVVIVLSHAVASSSSAPHPDRKPWHHTFGFGGTLDIDCGLALINGLFGPGEFFDDISVVESHKGTKYVKGKTEIQYFPEHMTLTVFVTGPIPIKGQSAKPEVDEQSMKDIRFEGKWKHGMDLRPAKRMTLLTTSTTQILNRTVWVYELTIDDSPPCQHS
jgi:hypothetical protein